MKLITIKDRVNQRIPTYNRGSERSCRLYFVLHFHPYITTEKPRHRGNTKPKRESLYSLENKEFNLQKVIRALKQKKCQEMERPYVSKIGKKNSRREQNTQSLRKKARYHDSILLCRCNTSQEQAVFSWYVTVWGNRESVAPTH